MEHGIPKALAVPPEAFLCPCPDNWGVIAECEGGYAVKRCGEDWHMEPKLSHRQLEEAFYRDTTKAEALESVRHEWEAEYGENIRDGEIREDRPEYYLFGFIDSPHSFEDRVRWLERFSGGLALADKAWIENTKGLIAKYHEVYKAYKLREMGGRV
jgi:hypothetical protein